MPIIDKKVTIVDGAGRDVALEIKGHLVHGTPTTTGRETVDWSVHIEVRLGSAVATGLAAEGMPIEGDLMDDESVMKAVIQDVIRKAKDRGLV